VKKFSLFLVPLDAVLAGFVAIVGGCLALGARFRKERNRKAIFLVPGADIASIHRKYGTLNVYLQDDPGFFEHVYRYLWGKTNCKIELRDNFTVIERRVQRSFPLLGIAWLFCSMSFTTFKEKISLVHARDPYFSGFLAYLIGLLSGRPFCVSIHTDYEKCELTEPGSMPRVFGNLRLARVVEKIVLKRAVMVLPISDYLRNVLKAKGVPDQKLRVFYHGIDMRPFLLPPKEDIFKKFGIKRGAKVISAISRMDKQHFSPDVVEIALRVVKENDSVCFLICGDGVERDKLIERVKEYGLEEKILFPGWVSNELAKDIRRQSYINLCLYDGISLIEACAAGRPVIAYDIEWNYELVINGETGYRVMESDVISAVKKIRYLLDNKDVADNLGRNARELAFSRHSLERVDENKRRIYLEILKK